MVSSLNYSKFLQSGCNFTCFFQSRLDLVNKSGIKIGSISRLVERSLIGTELEDGKKIRNRSET